MHAAGNCILSPNSFITSCMPACSIPTQISSVCAWEDGGQNERIHAVIKGTRRHGVELPGSPLLRQGQAAAADAIQVRPRPLNVLHSLP